MTTVKGFDLERVMIFIDGNNFYYGCKDTIGTSHIDFKKLLKFLAKDRELVKAYYYNALLDKSQNSETYKKQMVFFDELREVGIEVILCSGKAKAGRNIKGDDVNLAVDMLINAFKNSYDTAILVSGDGDFLPLVKAVKDEFRKKVENAIFVVNQSHDLTVLCKPNIIYMDNFIHKCKRSAILPFLKK